MIILDRKYIEIKDENNTSVFITYYDSGGNGQPVFFAGGFATFSASWEQVLRLLPEKNYRYIGMDLKGFGNSAKDNNERLSPSNQAFVIEQVLQKLNLDDIIMVGHSAGGPAILITMWNEAIRERVDRLILINCISCISPELQLFTSQVSTLSDDNPLIRYDNPEVTAYIFLRYLYARGERITSSILSSYGDFFRQNGARECTIAAVQQRLIDDSERFGEELKKIKLPTLIIHGSHDRISSKNDAEFLHKNISGSQLKTIPDCGHLPQEEFPKIIADLVTNFFRVELPVKKAAKVQEPPPVYSRLNMRRLIDRWSPGTMTIYFFVKLLQLFKKMGMRAEENGWRKATGIFLRNEYSKFALGSFRLHYYNGNHAPTDFNTARKQLIDRLASFLRNSSGVHWSVEPGFFQLGRRKLYFTDIVEAFWGKDGKLIRLEAHLDDSRSNFSVLNDSHVEKALKRLVLIYNKNLDTKTLKRPTTISRHMRRWAVRGERGVGFTGRLELRMLVDRILTATFIHCEVLSDTKELFLRRRLATPDIKTYRHPGWGLLNIICRFTPDFAEADLWMQYHHVPVDGMPMQELLRQLKNEWGSLGQLYYPALGSRDARPEMFYYGNRLFRARIYVSFEALLSIRKYMNERYSSQMGGQATIAGMIIWGLAQHEAFADSKVVFPVDLIEEPGKINERELSLVFIRPDQYQDEKDPISAFINFQKEFNWRIWRTRLGRSESYELLELYSMIHPLFYYIARYIFPKATGEILGTVGLTVIRDAEMFISPLSDLQENGFMSIGNLAMPTEDGDTAGVVSICGSRRQLKLYIEAIKLMSVNYPQFLGLPGLPVNKD